MARHDLGKITGKSAYEVWIEQGNSGSVDDFLHSIEGLKSEILNDKNCYKIKLNKLILLGGSGAMVEKDKPVKAFFPYTTFKNNKYKLVVTSDVKGAILNIGQKDVDGFYIIYTGVTADLVNFDYYVIGEV